MFFLGSIAQMFCYSKNNAYVSVVVLNGCHRDAAGTLEDSDKICLVRGLRRPRLSVRATPEMGTVK